jgi:molybdopterin/thiamine biosynthesis adenylyltransferase
MGPERYDRQKRIQGWDQSKLADATVAVIGAGALGNFVALELAMVGVGKIYIYDDDIIEDTNLNRQFLYYDAVGSPKATTLADKLSKINPEVDIKGYQMRIDDATVGMLSMYNPNIVMDCLDNLVTRAVLNKYCVDNKTALISGATSPMEGQVMQYIPGKTPCLDCQIDIYDLAEKERDRESCNHQPNASVIMTNAIIGSIMTEEARQILMWIDGDEWLEGILKYNGQLAREFANVKVVKKKNCDC